MTSRSSSRSGTSSRRRYLVASPYIIPAPQIQASRIAGRSRTIEAHPASTVPKKPSGIPIGAAIVVLIGVMVLSKGR